MSELMALLFWRSAADVSLPLALASLTVHL